MNELTYACLARSQVGTNPEMAARPGPNGSVPRRFSKEGPIRSGSDTPGRCLVKLALRTVFAVDLDELLGGHLPGIGPAWQQMYGNGVGEVVYRGPTATRLALAALPLSDRRGLTGSRAREAGSAARW